MIDGDGLSAAVDSMMAMTRLMYQSAVKMGFSEDQALKLSTAMALQFCKEGKSSSEEEKQ